MASCVRQHVLHTRSKHLDDVVLALCIDLGSALTGQGELDVFTHGRVTCERDRQEGHTDHREESHAHDHER